MGKGVRGANRPRDETTRGRIDGDLHPRQREGGLRARTGNTGRCHRGRSNSSAERQSALTPDRERGSQHEQEGKTMNAGKDNGSGVDAARLVSLCC